MSTYTAVYLSLFLFVISKQYYSYYYYSLFALLKVNITLTITSILKISHVSYK